MIKDTPTQELIKELQRRHTGSLIVLAQKTPGFSSMTTSQHQSGETSLCAYLAKKALAKLDSKYENILQDPGSWRVRPIRSRTITRGGERFKLEHF